MKQFFGLALLIGSNPILAQYHYSLHTLHDETHQPIPGVTIRIQPGDKTVISDVTGIAHLSSLRPGHYKIECTATGFSDREITTILPYHDTTLIITLDPSIETMQDVVITASRTNQLLRNTALTVQVIDREDIEEGTGQSPANIRELLTELSGTQMQQTSAVSGNVAIRLQGLDGRYTQLLKDGFPLYGGFSGSLSILQVPPLDLRQVEVIKGAGSALYGGDAIAGIINLVSRTPDTTGHLDAIANQTNRGGTDLGFFYGQRRKRIGLTVMTTASRQSPTDVNRDGFTDLPRVRQGTLSPTLFWYPSDSTTIRLGVNVSTENRSGGDLQAVRHNVDSLHPFLQQNHSDRDYYQLSLIHKGHKGQTFSLKNSTGYFYRSISQITGASIQTSGIPTQTTGFSGTEVSSFTEASYTFTYGAHQIVTGLGLTTDQFRPDKTHGSLGYTHNTAGVFAQDDWSISPRLTLETGARADIEHTLYFLPRVALLYRPLQTLTIRLGGGLAYKLPTLFNATDEEDGYQQTYPIATSLQAERSASANLSLNYRGRIGDDIQFNADQNFYYTRLVHALIPQADSLQRGWLYYLNAPGPVLSRGSETNARFTLDDLTLSLAYTYTDARQQFLAGHPQLPLTPRHRLVSSLTYEAEPHWKTGVEGFYTGAQRLDNGQTTRTFWTFDFLVQHSWGPLSLLLNLENFTDTRQSKFGPLYTGSLQKPVFGEIYAPLEGRMISVAIRYSR